MRRVVLLSIGVLLGLSAAPAAGSDGPALSYFMTKDDCRDVRTGGCTPKSQTSVSIGYSVIYTLEDGTYVGADHGNWDGPTSTGPSISDITLTQSNAIVADEVGRSWGSRLRDAIRGAIKGKSRLVPATNLGKAAAFLATPGTRLVAAVGSAV